jgi:hypothetical protein
MFKVGSEVSVFIGNGSLVQGKILASVEDDSGRHAYEIESHDDAFGPAPVKWCKAADVFMPTKKDTEFSADFR